ncbi:cytochrome c oxidase subunit II [Ilumatobacter nonamiensis]|uniref:cytochrome c oxidase subunit II n=1 Tax=Ilumatobacter nonamiensis TaxID=467093 RepID=UPI000345AF82|nr:cytochrome c oxidase subunit II [Ilumatobacter nonamiensis]
MTSRSPLAPPITDQADDIDRVWDVFLYLALGVLAFVVVLVVYVVIRFRRRDDRLPQQKHYNIPLEIAYTVVPFVLVVGLFAITVVTVNAIDDTDTDPDLTVHVTAFQWQWEFEYPESGVRIIGGADTDAPELVLPADSSVLFELESLDVIHSFWITAFRFKRDIIPGTVTEFSVDMSDDAAGEYPNAGVCAEYCGLDHALMRFSVRVLEPAEFDAWLVEQANDQEVAG